MQNYSKTDPAQPTNIYHYQEVTNLKKHKKIDIMEIVSLKLYNHMFNVTLTNDDMIPLTMLFGYFHLKEKLLL